MPVNTPNMNLLQPVIGTDSGLTWEQSTNSNANTLDSHNHTPGNGVLIPSAGLNINASLPFNNQKATTVAAVEYQDQSGFTDTRATYTNGGELYYNDGSGNAVKITSGGAVNATSSGISSGTATASFVSSTLVVNSDVNKPANIKGGSVLIGNNTTGSHYLTLQPPNAMAADYSITLPALPGSQSFVTVDTTGNLSGYASIAQGITRSNLASVGQQVSSSSGSFGINYSNGLLNVTNLSVNITTTGRPVIVTLQPDGTSSPSEVGVGSTTSASYSGNIKFFRDNGPSPAAQAVFSIGGNATGASGGFHYNPPGAFFWLDTPSAGTHNYQVLAQAVQIGSSVDVTNVVLVVYEL